MKKLLISFSAITLTANLLAQTGTIRGKVVNGESAELMLGATVQLAGTTIGSITDLDGNYEIKVKPGTYALVCKFISFTPDTIKGVVVKEGEITKQDFSLRTKAQMIKVFEVEGKQSRNNANYITKLQQKSATVMNGISSDEISQRGDGNAAAVAKRVTGVSIEGGKYVYVRGLSDRYSKTTLNGAEIPGLDPNRNSVQLDLFPSNLIENMTVVKSFTPDLPGSFTGGLVNIETKDFPDELTMQFSTSLGYNPQANFNNNFISSPGGSTDNLGFDDGTRERPVSAIYTPPLFENNDELENDTKAFNKNLTPTRKTSGLNQSHSFSFGNQKKLFGKSLGFIGGITYAKSYDYYNNGTTGRYTLTGHKDNTDFLTTQLLMGDEQGSENVLWGALANISYKLSKRNKIGLILMRNQNGINNTRYQEGIIPSDQIGLHFQTRSLQYVQRALSTAQLRGEHAIDSVGKFKADWQVSYTLAQQKEPDLRFFANDYELTGQNEGDTIFSLQPALYPVPSRYYREMADNNVDAKLNFELPIKEEKGKTSKLKFGASNVARFRTFEEKRYDYRNQNVNYTGDPQTYFSDSNMVVGNPNGFLYMQNASQDRNSYVGSENVAGAYLMGDLFFGERTRLIAGARVEKTNILVVSDDVSLPEGELDNLDVLPSVSAIYALKKDTMNLRFAYSRTLARPTFRELAPFGSFDFIGDFIVVGSDSLKRTTIDNFDVRWEMFPRLGEAISVAGFYKRFVNPIERAFNPVSAVPELNYRNVAEATVYGAELEIRKNLSFISKGLSNFSAGGNFTYVYSEVSISPAELEAIRATDPDHPEKRAMFGQSPYIVNTFLGYKSDSAGITAGISYNVAGEKLAVVIVGGTPNVYQQPAGQLDFTFKKSIGKRWNIKFSARNLLDPEYRMIQSYKGEEYLFQSFTRGRSFSIGVQYKI